MPTDKIIQINLTELTQKSLGELIKIKEEIATNLDKTGKRNKKQKLGEFQRSDEESEKIFEKLKKELELELIAGKGGSKLKKALFGNFDFSKGGMLKNIVGFGLNPSGFFGGILTKGIPGFGTAVAATGIILKILKKFDDLEKKFTDDLRTRLNIDRDNEQTALVQAGIAQEITTLGPGITDPRDSYNTNDVFNNEQTRIETDYTIRTTLGVE